MQDFAYYFTQDLAVVVRDQEVLWMLKATSF